MGHEQWFCVPKPSSNGRSGSRMHFASRVNRKAKMHVLSPHNSFLSCLSHHAHHRRTGSPWPTTSSSQGSLAAAPTLPQRPPVPLRWSGTGDRWRSSPVAERNGGGRTPTALAAAADRGGHRLRSGKERERQGERRRHKRMAAPAPPAAARLLRRRGGASTRCPARRRGGGGWCCWRRGMFGSRPFACARCK
jgi:hypothetical protein